MERNDSCFVANLVAREGNPGEVTLPSVARFFDDRERNEGEAGPGWGRRCRATARRSGW